MKLRIFILFLFLPILSVQAGIIDSLMIHPRDSIGLTSDSLVLRYLQESGIPISDNNKVKLLKSGREKFIDLFEAIREAKHHVHLEYFNFRNDSIANALFALLAEKVKEGVEVRAMFDAFGNWSNNKPLKKRHLKKIREQGIEIVKFDPFTFPYINHAAHRDHRKIAVIDGKVAYTGGMNIADYYINGLPKIGTWRDMHMRIEGDAVNDLQEIFLTIWNKETKQNIGGEAYFPQHQEQTDSTNIVVAIVDRTPKKNSRMLSHAYAMSIYSAQKNVHIVNPYFVPTSSIKKALNRTIDRGVDVTIMVSSASYIPGRLRTASSPSRTVMLSASYCVLPIDSFLLCPTWESYLLPFTRVMQTAAFISLVKLISSTYNTYLFYDFEIMQIEHSNSLASHPPAIVL